MTEAKTSTKTKTSSGPDTITVESGTFTASGELPPGDYSLRTHDATVRIRIDAAGTITTVDGDCPDGTYGLGEDRPAPIVQAEVEADEDASADPAGGEVAAAGAGTSSNG